MAAQEKVVMSTTAAFAIWHIGVAFIFGTVIYQLLKRGLVTLRGGQSAG